MECGHATQSPLANSSAPVRPVCRNSDQWSAFNLKLTIYVHPQHALIPRTFPHETDEERIQLCVDLLTQAGQWLEGFERVSLFRLTANAQMIRKGVPT